MGKMMGSGSKEAKDRRPGPLAGVYVGSQVVSGIDAPGGVGASVLAYEDEGNEWRN